MGRDATTVTCIDRRLEKSRGGKDAYLNTIILCVADAIKENK
jgi:hypothetical protein